MTTLKEIIAQAAPHAKPVGYLHTEITFEWSEYGLYEHAELDGRLTSEVTSLAPPLHKTH